MQENVIAEENTQAPIQEEQVERLPTVSISTEAQLQFGMVAPGELREELMNLGKLGESEVLEALLKKHGDTEDFLIAAIEWWVARGLRRMLPVILGPLGVQVVFSEVKGRYDPVELPEGASVQTLHKEAVQNGESTN
jgi:hypothetical protein